ncbi:unnamed protein product [Effrenium voratum]|uniref:Uncharacterized protein n=1 Tax=Effrenium voratum TaxID=2562239 RepID=A0AA36HQC9_9DINO|nr:unnamed protein product [Effrenium voratum]
MDREPGDDSRDVVAQMVVNKLNSAGDFHALVDSLVFAAVSVLTALLLFSFLRPGPDPGGSGSSPGT